MAEKFKFQSKGIKYFLYKPIYADYIILRESLFVFDFVALLDSSLFNILLSFILFLLF